MITEIDRDAVRPMMAAGAQLVDVRVAADYESEHLPGALSLPLKSLDRDTAAPLDRQRPVITYCWDSQWDLSARAAWRLVSLGFSRVYRYTAGKEDWIAFDLPTEGKNADTPTAGDVARRDVPTCTLTDRLGEVRERIGASGWTSCIVVNDRNVVLGRVRSKDLDGDPDQSIAAVMEAGPVTERPSEPLEALVQRMQEKRVSSVIVSRPDGQLIGVLRREDGAQRLAK
jgi:rhodanese-related sulfurtransferase/CBS domain-containing protein